MITKKKIRVSSEEWDLFFNDKKDPGGSFSTLTEKGRGKMEIGTSLKNKRLILNILLHEIIEAILSIDSKRYQNGNIETATNYNFDFRFNHEYLSSFVEKLIDSLLSCDAIKINGIDK